jgi:hypothetical protein
MLTGKMTLISLKSAKFIVHTGSKSFQGEPTSYLYGEGKEKQKREWEGKCTEPQFENHGASPGVAIGYEEIYILNGPTSSTTLDSMRR